jgi:type VI secretion system secreted protein Hcp
MAVDMFLKLDGIKGESQDLKHKNEIDILSFSWGASNTTSFGTGGGGGAGAGKVSIHDISFVHRIDKASPKLMLACATGQLIPTGTLTVRKKANVPVEYLKLTMSECLVSSFSVSGNSAGTPTESVTFVFQKVKVEYFPQNQDGSIAPPIVAELTNVEFPQL